MTIFRPLTGDRVTAHPRLVKFLIITAGVARFLCYRSVRLGCSLQWCSCSCLISL